MSISMDKEYTTRDGCEVRLYALDGGSGNVIHGAVNYAGEWMARVWPADGTYVARVGGDPRDLIEKPETIEVPEFWIVMYDTGAFDIWRHKPGKSVCHERVKHIIHHPARTILASESAQ